ncbi:MAG: hypothetical protein E7515_02990 [Ruminococcaceae bacterium]|nr:hypothetical protein [Oscillospiraceae bacterium]
MKKVLSIVLSIVMVFSVFSVMPFTVFADNIRGDANGDGKVNMSDAITTRYIDAIGTFPDCVSNYSEFGADANGDNKITVADTLAVMKHLVYFDKYGLIGAPALPSDGKADDDSGDFTLDLGGTKSVNAGDSFDVDVKIKLKDTTVKIAAVDIQFLFDSPMTCEEVDFSSSVLGHEKNNPKEGKCETSPDNDIVAAMMYFANEYVTPSDNSVLFTLSINVPATTPDGEYTIDIADRCQVFSDENGTMYRTSVNPLTVTVTNNNLLGSGTATDPYKIDSYSKLKAFADKVNIDSETGANAVLTADIVADDEAWTPIGNGSNIYTGTFDGDGHTITGLTTPENYGEYAGLFGYVGTDGVIKNVGLEGGSINGSYDVGGIVGLNMGTIQNCYNTGAVNGENSVGGIVGYNCNGDNRSTNIVNCYNTGAVSGNGTRVDVGGIVGRNIGVLSGSSSVTDCYNIGTISGNGTRVDVGGIVGYNICATNGSADITDCYNTGAVMVSGDNVYVGGIIGEIFGSGGGTAKVANCYYDRNVVTVPGATSENNWNAIGKNYNATVINVTGLTTVQMTGIYALTNMEFSDSFVWFMKEDVADDTNGKYYMFYPHLKGFNHDGDGAQQTGEEISPDNWPAKAEVSVDWSGSDSYTYNATEQKPVVSSVSIGGSELTPGADYTVNYKVKNGDNWDGCTECINAGEYRTVITFGNGHPDIVKNFTINKASLEITAKNKEYEYNGFNQGPGDTVYENAQEIANVITAEGLKGTDTVTQIEIDGQGKNAGDDYVLTPQSAFINGTNAADSNYDVTYVNGVLKINPKAINVTVNGNSDTKTYNGSQQTFNGTFTATCPDTGFDASKFTYTGSTSVSGKDAGEYTLSPVEANCVYDDSNYTVSWTMGTPIKLKVNPAKITIAADNKETNHGDDLDELTYKITGDYYGEDLGISLSTDADNKTPGTYDITVSYTPNSNYNVTVQNGKYVIDDNPHTWGEITYEWNGTDSVTASRTCNYCGEVETETVNPTAEQTKDPTCTDKGENTYTATFTNPAFETQTKTVEDVEAAGHKLTHYPYTEPTSTKDGNVEYWYCEECHKYFSDENGENEITETVIPLVPEYTFDKDNLEWTKDSGEDLEFTVNRSADDDKAFGLFLGIEIDGNAVSEENYTATKGSVNIKLSADYLETLSVGEHTLKLLFTDGETETTFTVNGKEEPDEPAKPDGEKTDEPVTKPEKKDSKPAGYEPIPKTGNAFNPWICIAVLAGPCLAAVYGRKRKEDE